MKLSRHFYPGFGATATMSEYTCKFTFILINFASDNMSSDASIMVMGDRIASNKMAAASYTI